MRNMWSQMDPKPQVLAGGEGTDLAVPFVTSQGADFWNCMQFSGDVQIIGGTPW